MNTKFEEAKYIKGANVKIYSAEKITAIRSSTPQVYANIKEYLFCPECEEPHLTHNMCESKQNYFSTYPKQNHLTGCTYECEKASKKILSCLAEKQNLNNLYIRLQNSILLFMKMYRIEKNPCIICKETDDTLLRQATKSKKSYENRYYIPRKRLTNYMDENCIDSYKIFYGKAELKWRSTNGFYPHKLNIYHHEQKRLICSLAFSDNVYSYLPAECKQFETGIRFKAFISFYTKLELNVKENQVELGKSRKKFYNGIINDSRKIFFLEVLPVD